MGIASTKPTKDVSLVRNDDDPQVLPGLDAVGERMARGIRAMVTDLCPIFPEVTLQPIRRITFGDWRAEHMPNAGVCQFSIKPLKGSMLVVIPPRFVAQLVDCFYGGEGDVDTNRDEFSRSEIRFLERLGETLVGVVTAAWADTHALSPALVRVDTEMVQISSMRDTHQIIVQPVSIKADPFGSVDIECIYPAATLRTVKALAVAVIRELASATDSVWQDRLRDAIMEVSLPVRTIFARTELPLARLLQLQTGDLIPICLPNRIPVTVGGLTFAEGTVGESNGRASIRIEKLEQGRTSHD